MPRYTYPHTIQNGAGEEITFLGVEDGPEDGPEGPRLLVENRVQPGSGPPMHVHHRQEEALTVLAGRMGYERPGEAPRTAEAGETVRFAPGEAHRFWNAGEDELRAHGHIQPPDNVEYFLTEIYASQARNGGHRPGLLDAAYLARRYRSEFAMQEIPAPVQTLLFPLLVALGRALGRYRRYDDAPPPFGG